MSKHKYKRAIVTQEPVVQERDKLMSAGIIWILSFTLLMFVVLFSSIFFIRPWER